MSKTRALTLVLTAGLVVACQQEPPPPTAVTPRSKAKLATSAASSAASATKPEAVEDGRFQRYAQGSSMRLAGSYGTTAALFVAHAIFPTDLEGVHQVTHGQRYSDVAGEALTAMPQWTVGKWPSRAFVLGFDDDEVVLSLWQPRGTRPGWLTERPTLGEDGRLVDVSSYQHGSLLAIEHRGEHDWQFVVAHASPSKPVQAPQRRPAAAAAAPCKAALKPWQIRSFDNGEAFVLGVDCASTSTPNAVLALEYYRDGKVHALELPAALRAAGGGKESYISWLALSPVKQFIATPAGVARFDGKKWQMIGTQPVRQRRALATASDNSLWLLSKQRLYSRSDAVSDWQAVGLPASVAPVAISTSPGVVPWVLVMQGRHRVLLGPPSDAKPTTLPSKAAVWRTTDDMLPAASSACEKLFVPLRVDKASGPTWEQLHSELKKTAAELRIETVVRPDGKKLIGVRPQSYIEGHNLVAVAKRVETDSIARLTCPAPRAGR